MLFLKRESPWTVMKGASWEILPLVAGLFVLVEALDHSGVLNALIHVLQTRPIVPRWRPLGERA